MTVLTLAYTRDAQCDTSKKIVYCNIVMNTVKALLENNFLVEYLIQARVHDRSQFQRFQLNVNSPQKSKAM